ncbi:toxic anion resistance protein [Evansella cellulosilytica]|uniref:Toxic anion resistance family protein n=1 Tax=Evansella cellulosilytica (strain ATCC 21833 / DSM 2522 / FERM P-1141 / JCM 9156 / N-4) TaxID=649639 RepID=E6U080_EVAC2|nr:toxic anion resistance protein [Evansella cellulosilytica]ADU30196.1 toxic anion resistance family protein [Evansella cellulosilytica DSM 2522]
MDNKNLNQEVEQSSSIKKTSAERYVEEIRQENDLNKVLESLGKIGLKEQEKAGESLEALKRPVNAMMNDPKQDLPDQLAKLKEMVSELEPDYLKEGKLKKFFSKMVRKSPIEKYARKYQTIEAEVETIIGALLNGKDRLQEDNVMLHQLKDVAKERIIGLNEQIEIGKQLNTMLEEELKKEEWQHDPAPIQKGQQKVLSRVKNMQTAVLVLQQSLASVDIIVENNDKLEEAIFNAITMTKNIITVTASIQLALSNQKKVIDAVKNVNDTTEAMLLSNAQLLKSNTEETLKTLEEPAIALETFKKAYEDVYAAIEMTEQSNTRIIESSKQFITEMEQLNDQMERKLLN